MRSEDSMNEIRDFLNERLSDGEAAAFRQRMAEDPILEEEVAFARLLLGGLEEIAKEKVKRRRRKRIGWSFGSLVVLLAAFLFYVLKIKAPATPRNASPPPVRAADGAQKIPLIRSGGDSPLADSDRPASIVWNSRGEAIVAGLFRTAIQFGEHALPGFGKEDIFLAACDPLDFRWARQIGSPGSDFAEKIAVDAQDNILLTGRICNQTDFLGKTTTTLGNDNGNEGGEFFIAKTDPAGALLWLDHGGGVRVPNRQTGSNLGTAIAADHSGNVIAAGTYVGSPRLGAFTLPEGGPNEDLYLAKYNPEGRLLWVKTVTCSYMLAANDLCTDDDGNIYLTGYFGHHNLGGSADFGNATLHSYGGRDIFIAKYSPNGSLAWVRQAGSPNADGRDFGQSIAIGADGNCVVTGWFEGTARFDPLSLVSRGGRDVFIASYDPAGKLLWARGFGGEGSDQGNALCLDTEGNVYCTGHFSGNAFFGENNLASTGAEDAFVVKINPAGALLWVQPIGGDLPEANSDRANGIAVDVEGNLVVTGVFSGKMTFGNHVFASQGREDVFLLFFDRNGKMIKARRMLGWQT
jgi:hypothetical protein